MCGCWLHLCDDEEDIRHNRSRGEHAVEGEDLDHLGNLKLDLQRVISILKIAVSETAAATGEQGGGMDIDSEFHALLSGDERLRDLLFQVQK